MGGKMSWINQLINNQVSELFALFTFFVGAGIMWAVMMDTKQNKKENKNARSR